MRRRRAGRRATAAVELAVVLPFIITLLFGIWEVGRLIDIQQVVTNSAREGGRQASTGQLTNTQVQQVVKDYIRDAVLPSANVAVLVENLTSPGTDANAASQLDQFRITVTIPFQDVRWLALNYFMPAGSSVTGQTLWSSVKDRDYPSSPGAPPGY